MVLGRTVTRQRIPASLVVLALFIGSSLRWFTMMATSTTAAAAAISSVMPKIGLGTLLLERQQVRSTLLQALELGYRRIDCAPVYFNEDVIGDVLKEQTIVNRKDLFIVSKLASPFHKQEHVELALRKTLTDLRLDYLDLYLVHWPIAFHYVPIDPTKRGFENEDIDDSDGGKNIDPAVSLLETWRGMEDAVKKGLVKQIGLSNVPGKLLHELLWNDLEIKPAVLQVELHPYLQQNRLVKYCMQRGIQIQAYSPLGTPGYKEDNEPVLLEDLKDIATSGTPAQVAIAWALQRGTSVVVKSTSKAHLKENMEAVDIVLTDGETNKIAELNRNYRFFRPKGKLLLLHFDTLFYCFLANLIILYKTGGDQRVPCLARQRTEWQDDHYNNALASTQQDTIL